MSRQERVEVANKAIQVIASHGRKFFSLHAECRRTSETERFSQFILADNGRLWFQDKYTGKLIYVAYRSGHWRYFSEGGTLRDLICAMADWINGKSAFPLNRLGPWPKWVCDGDLWGYGDSMLTVRDEIKKLLSASAQWTQETMTVGRDPSCSPQEQGN